MSLSVPSSPPPPPTSPQPSPFFCSLTLWLGLQLLSLLLAAMRLPLSANFPQPAERLASDWMAITQVVAVSLLFGLLFRSVRGTTLIVVCSWPMLQLAGFLAGTPPDRLLLAGLYITCWLLAMASLSYVFRSNKLQLYAAALTGAITLGGPLLWYIRAEFAHYDAGVNWSIDGALGPLMGALAQLHAPRPPAAPWIFIITALLLNVLPALLLLLRRRRGERHRSHTHRPSPASDKT